MRENQIFTTLCANAFTTHGAIPQCNKSTQIRSQ